MGPILLFDKSTLESLSVDEAVWLDAHYNANITPLFFVETLADLEKEIVGGRTPEQVVGNLAEKTPDEGQPNVHFLTLCVNELLGGTVEMRGSIILAGGEPVESGGRRGVVFKESPEMAALRRWQEGKFLEVERGFARVWRKVLSGLDLDAVYREGRDIIQRHGRPRDLPEAKALAVALHEKPGSRCTREALKALPVLEEDRCAIAERWRVAGEPRIAQFAPFTAHVLAVDSFFTIALGADFISRDRPSNKVDIAYLYYLPFCMVFTSNDNLHARTAPLFLGERQEFVRGQELKTDLSRLDEYYSALPTGGRTRRSPAQGYQRGRSRNSSRTSLGWPTPRERRANSRPRRPTRFLFSGMWPFAKESGGYYRQRSRRGARRERETGNAGRGGLLLRHAPGGIQVCEPLVP